MKTILPLFCGILLTMTGCDQGNKTEDTKTGGQAQVAPSGNQSSPQGPSVQKVEQLFDQAKEYQDKEKYREAQAVMKQQVRQTFTLHSSVFAKLDFTP